VNLKGEVSSDPELPSVPSKHGRGIGLGTQILIGMGVGSALGVFLGEQVEVIQPIGDLFIRMLVLAAVPLVFFNLLAGLTALSDVRMFGRLAGKIMSYYVITDLVAISLGIGAMAILRPGVGMQLSEQVEGSVGAVPSVAEVLLGMVPTNVFQAFAEGNVVQLVVISVLLGVATILIGGTAGQRLANAYQDLARLFRKLVDLILLIAPVGIGALMAVTVGRYGTQLIGPMTRFLLGVWTAQFVVFLGYMMLLRFFTTRSPGRFLRDTGPLWATTAATTSSLASLSVGLEVAEKISLPRAVYSFTLPLGAQLNKDGTSVMLGAVLLFTAQAAGVEFAPAAFLTILLVGLLLSEGSGGIPGGGFVIALIYVQAFNLPIEVAAIVGGIYRLVDMGNTTVNIMGDMIGTSIVAESEAGRT
jgi:Na+/H+-dicarboxylate symporter